MGVFSSRGYKPTLVAAVGLVAAVIVIMVALPSTGCARNTVAENVQHAETPGLTPFSGSGVGDRQVLGLCTHDLGVFKSKVISSQWGQIRNVRVNLQWALIEKSGHGRFNWGWADNQINQALSVGLNGILVTLGGPLPGWAINNSAGKYKSYAPPKKMQYWYDFCYAVAKRYKGVVDFYQIWQEPGWDIDSPPAQYGTVYFGGLCDLQYTGMMRAGYQAIKKVDPAAFVSTGSMMNGITRTANDFRNYDELLSGRGQDISMKVQADQDIVTERPMYFNYHGAWPGGHTESGIAAPQKTWYLAEGATHPGFEEWICIQNPGNIPAAVTITYMFPGGQTQNQSVKVGPHQRSTVDVNRAVGPYKDVSAKVHSPQPIVVERPMYFLYHNAWPGGSIEAGVPNLSNTWYLAEGATHSGFEEWISLMNPNPAPTTVTITYMFKGGGTQKQVVNMAQTSRETVLVNSVVGPNKDVSAKVESKLPIIAERPMYYGYHGKWPGGDTEVGATAPGTSWFFSEGTTRNNQYDGNFEEWISIQNPGNSMANVDLTYMFPGGGTKKQLKQVPAHSRETILVNEVIGNDKDVSVKLESKVPIIAERPLYFNYHDGITGGSIELGSQTAGKTWYMAEGTTRDGFDEWLTLQNPGSVPANATITFMFGDGTTQQKKVALLPNSRTTVSVNESVSIATVTDAIAVHPYDYPVYWAQYYNTVKSICAQKGHPNLEVIVSEIGWPHAGRAEFSMEGQRQAVGAQGIGSLWGAGCRKIWVYEDIDDPPGTSWDALDSGLFTYTGGATPAWSEYGNWQNQLLNYGNKKTHL